MVSPPDLRSDPLYVKVYTLLKTWIMEGRLAPGDRLGETSLAAELQVSRTPVRDALRRLEQDRLIVPVAGPAYEVYRPTLDDLTYLYTARAVLEGGCARLAAARRPPETAAMAEVVAQMARAYGQEPLQHLLDLDTQFHELLVAASANPMLVELHSHLSNRLRMARSISGDVNARRDLILGQHTAIVKALCDGDEAEAERATRTHIMTVYDLARATYSRPTNP